MPVCRECKKEFDGTYRERYCSIACQLAMRTEKQESGCWLWRGATTKSGYGVLNIRGKLLYTHRAAYEITNGEIPDGLFVCHTCDTPDCVNPDHLFAGEHQDNMSDMARKGRAAWAGRKMPQEIRSRIAATRRASGWNPSPQHRESVRKATLRRWEELRKRRDGGWS